MVFLFEMMFKSEGGQKPKEVIAPGAEKWVEDNFHAVGFALTNYCKGMSVNSYEMLFPKNAKDGDSFRLVLYSDDKRVKTLEFTINNAAKDETEKYTVKVIPPVDVTSDRTKSGLEKNNYAKPISGTIKNDNVSLPYNTYYTLENKAFNPTPMPAPPLEISPERHYIGNTQLHAYVVAQTNVEKSKVYAKSIEDSTAKLDYLYSSLQNKNTPYTMEPAFDTQANYLLTSLVNAASGPKNSNYFILAQKDLRYDFLIPGSNAEQEVKTTSYYLVPKDYDVGNGGLAEEYKKNQVSVVMDVKNNKLVDFVFNGKVIARQDREKAGVPKEVNVMIGGSDMKLVSTVPVYMYYKGDEQLAKSVTDFDGKTEVEVEGKKQVLDRGSYNVFTATVADEETGETKQQIVSVQKITDKSGKPPKGITKQAEQFILESLPNELDRDNLLLGLASFPHLPPWR